GTDDEVVALCSKGLGKAAGKREPVFGRGRQADAVAEGGEGHETVEEVVAILTPADHGEREVDLGRCRFDNGKARKAFDGHRVRTCGLSPCLPARCSARACRPWLPRRQG